MTSPLTISRVHLRISRQPGQDLGATAPYLIHQAIADLFGDRPDRGYLFRVLRDESPEVVALVVSQDQPLPVERLRSPDHRQAVHVESKPYAPALYPGQHLDFELRVNAVRQKVDEQTHKTLRTDLWDAVWGADPETRLTPHEVYGAWLANKLSDCATVRATRVTERGEVRARRPGDRMAASFIAANLIGQLEVVGPDGLLAVIGAGLGRSRAFGCGLLCLSSPGSVLPRRHPAQAASLGQG